jgi:hypothetical protein
MVVLRQTLSQTFEWVIEQMRNQKQDFQRVKVQLALT